MTVEKLCLLGLAAFVWLAALGAGWILVSLVFSSLREHFYRDGFLRARDRAAAVVACSLGADVTEIRKKIENLEIEP